MLDQLAVAKKAAQQAGSMITSQQGRTSIAEKADHNLVTAADYAAQEAIIKTIKNEYPAHSIIAEENDYTAQIDAPDLWIIDPLDGTNNFAHNIPHYSVSIAYARAGQLIAGVVYDPVRDELFSAALGLGACLNDQKITVSEAASLQQAVIATGFYYDRGKMMKKTLQSIEHLFAANIHGIRRFGSAALDLCWVACGRFDAYFEYQLSTWDFAAGMLIVSEAGGLCTDPSGKTLTLKSAGVIASNGHFHNHFLEVVRWSDHDID